MGGRQAILDAAAEIMREGSGTPDAVTMRAVCERAGVGLGLVNYHFRSKDKLIEACTEEVVRGVVSRFREIQEEMADTAPREKLSMLGQLCLDFLFDNEALCRISIISDVRRPSPSSNTVRTWQAFVPLVAECRPDLADAAVKRITWSLVMQMQQAFVQCDVLKEMLGIDLRDAEQRAAFHNEVVRRTVWEVRA